MTPARLFAILGLVLCCRANATEPPQPAALVFGIVPQQSAVELAKGWAPILAYLSAKTGRPLRFATAKDIPTFEARLAAGEYDLAYMNPNHYTVVQRSPGYRVFAKEEDRKLKGIVVVRKEDAYTDLGQLHGQAVAFPGPGAFAATLLTQAEFRRRGAVVEPVYVSSHDSVYLSVAAGRFNAGGGIPRTFENTKPEVRERLRILWSSPGHAPHAIAAHPRLSADTVKRMRAAMTKMAEDPRGAALLQAIGFKGLEAAEDPDYDGIRGLELRPPMPESR